MKLPILILFFLFKNLCYCQNIESTPKERFLFNELTANFSMVNIGQINHWHIPLNFDSSRPYMHYSIGLQGSLTENISLRLDYFSNYNNFVNEAFLNPSIITISPRLIFNKNSLINLFIDVKFGVAIIESESSYPYRLASNLPKVIGIRTGLNTQICKNVFLGFSFDNLGIYYKYTYFSYHPTYSLQTGYDASRISVLTTDIIYRFKSKVKRNS